MGQIDTASVQEVQIGDFIVTRIADDLSWGVGSIQPQDGLNNDADQQRLIETVIASLSRVNAAELAYSSCTDGRLPIKLLDGEAVPVREQIVGTDTMLFFHMAEALGSRFYKDPNEPLAERIQEVIAFMRDSGLVPCTHVACGAAAGYVPINENLVRFTAEPKFAARQQALLPEGVYDESLRATITKGYQDRLERGAYADWSDALLMEAVKTASGDHAIAELNDDQRGVHGHVEEQIVRIQVDGLAINETQVCARTSGREVFGVNDLRLQRHAQLIGRGQEEDYKIALMAAEDFTDGGHGTLAKDLPTYIVRAI
ncbi:MAG TPA: hypothetical protein VD735_02195 [Candidatus Saccharimonadales bacterium]|nr:hypothetical protein [Candidatus Saccharimonadales bacterium]